MKIIDGIRYSGKPFWIPGASRKELPEFLKQRGLKKGVEVGVSWGQNIVDYCKAGLDITGIDPWKDTRDNTYRKIISVPGCKTIEEVHQTAINRTKDYPNCKLVQKLSVDALDDFPDRSLDFVYIDASHDFGYIAMDLYHWSRKVKKGGVIAGHDYYSTTGIRAIRHVGNVVDAFAKSYDFEDFYVLGTKEDYVDRELSYLFFKHW